MTDPRSRRKTLEGVVTSAKAPKTISVRIERMVRHPAVEKYIRRRTVVYAHDEAREAHEGDLVQLMETRPISKTKRWRLVAVVRRQSS